MIDNQEAAVSAVIAYARAKLGQWFPHIDEDVDMASQISERPALFFVHLGAEDTWSGTVLPRTELELQAWIFAKTSDDDTPGQVLRQLLYGFRDAFRIDPFGGPLTMKNAATGQVYATMVRVEGKTAYYPGKRGTTDAVAIVPMKLLLP